MKRAISAFVIIAALVVAVMTLSPRPLLLNHLSFSKVLYDRNGTLLRTELTSDYKYRIWVPLSDIAPHVIEATVAYEDRFFFSHYGFNPASLLRALLREVTGRWTRSGGSTLTMQLARLRFGLRTRSVIGKARQIYYALILEWHFTKKELLEAYLNLVPYGGNIEGIGAASLIYFQKAPKDLSVQEAISLVIIPQSPLRRTLTKIAEVSKEDTMTARAVALRRLCRYRSAYCSSESFTLPLAVSDRAALPLEAPHFVHDLAQRLPSGGRYDTSLDLSIQKTVEGVVRRFVERLREQGLENISVLIADHQSLEVHAAIGSADYFDNSIQGKVNGIRGRRSPGSALKPFVYGLAIDSGLIHPETLLKDIPTSVALYSPENFDRIFLGPLHATEALVRSRNAPTLQLMRSLPPSSFYKFLLAARIGRLRDENWYGLSLALGGVEITLEEGVRLYAMLARGGRYPLQLSSVRGQVLAGNEHRTGGSRIEDIPLLTPEAAYLVLEMLSKNPRPHEVFRVSPSPRDGMKVAWKTGTSWGFRDAWAIGIAGRFVLGVWSGNFKGAGNPIYIGRSLTGELFFEILDALSAHGALHPEAFPKASRLKIEPVKVCAVSGELPGPDCPHTITTHFVPGVSPISHCHIHRSIYLHSERGVRLCSPFAQGAVRKVVEIWPSDLEALFRRAGFRRTVLPESDDESCAEEGVSPTIISPDEAATYHVKHSARMMKKETRLPLRASADGSARMLYWFVDETFIGKALPTEVLDWEMRPGNFVVRVIDDRGRSSSIRLRVGVVQ